MKLLLTAALGFGLATVALAQTSSPASDQLPPGPLIKELPDYYQWTISSRRGAGSSSGGVSASENGTASKQISGRRTGDIRQIVISYSNGNKTIFWKKGKLQYALSAGWKIPVVGPAPKDEIYGDLSWVSAANFQGISAVGGRKCMVFRDRIFPPGIRPPEPEVPLLNMPADYVPPPQDRPDPESLKVNAIACIDLELRFPVVIHYGDEVTTYKFDPIDPQVPIQLPAEVQAAFATKVQQQQATVRRPVRP